MPAAIVPPPEAARAHALLSLLKVSREILCNLLDGLQQVLFVMDFDLQFGQLLGIGLLGYAYH
jgi:hypothetical protein